MATVKFRIRRDTAANWVAVNPVLGLGEPGLETDTRKVKYGDGATVWTSLAYSAAGAIGWADVTSKPTTLAGYGITDAQPVDSDLTAIAALATTSYGRGLLTTADAASLRATAGLGTMALQNAASVAVTGGALSGLTSVGIGATATDALHIAAATFPRIRFQRTGIGDWYVGNLTAGGTGNSFGITLGASNVIEFTSGLATIAKGTLSITGHGTTASGANAYIDSATGLLSRSTSSLAFKRDPEPMEPAFADALLGITTIWYRSAIEEDRQDWSWWGIAAEELAAIDPRLVHWGYLPEDYDQRRKDRRLKSTAELRPVGVAYDRLTVPLLNIIQRMNQRIEVLEQQLAALHTN